MFYKTYNFFIHKNRMFPYFENKVKNVSDIVNNNNDNNNSNNIEISKRQLHIIRLNHVLLDINKLSKDTAFMFTFTPFSSVKLAASKNF